MKLKKRRVAELLEQLEQIENEAKALEKKYEKRLKKIHPANQKSALNLIHYLALRNQDIRDLQDTLGQLGISRLGRAESHVMASIAAVKNLLNKILKKEQVEVEKPAVSFKKGRKILRANTSSLLGKKLKGSKVRIMVTLPTDAADDYKFIKKLVTSGMNSARINCAHDDPEVWKRMIDKINKAKKQTGRNVKVCMDLGGPKLRTGSMRPGPKVVHLQPERDLIGKVTSPSEVWLAPAGTESEDDMIIPVSSDWLKSLKKNSIIIFTDSRNKNCKLKIDKKRSAGWMAKCYDSAYVTTGTVLKIKSENKGGEKTTEVGEMLPLEEKIILKVGDKLILHKDTIQGDPAQDLTVTWEGGNDDGKVALRLMPHFRRHRDHHDRLHFDRIIFEILDTNTGEYTFTSEQIQELLNGVDARHFVLGVSQMDFGEVEHDNGVLHTAMRNGNSVMLAAE